MEIRNATGGSARYCRRGESLFSGSRGCHGRGISRTAAAHYASHFWLLLEQGKLVAFVDGFLHRDSARPDRMRWLRRTPPYMMKTAHGR